MDRNANNLSGAVVELEHEKVASLVGVLAGVVADLERDRMTQAGEACSLSAVIYGLHSDQVRHEVPRLGGSPQTPIACDARDAEGLLRIVEAQASDLVRLRRALLSAQTMAAQRLLVIHADANARERERERGQETKRVFEWVRSISLEEIIRIQEAISDVIERSRWRRIGQRLGLAKRLAWETGHWQTHLSEATAGSAPSADDRIPGASMAELLVELERLHGLLDQLRLSRVLN